MAFIGTPLDTRNTFQSLVGKRFNGDGSTTAFTLDVAPSSVVHQAKSVGTIGIPDDTISARTLVTADSSADHVIIEDATDGELKKALYPSGFSVSSITGATALDAVPADTDEFVLSDAGTLKRTDFKNLIQNGPFFSARQTSNQNIANTTLTKVEFSTEIADPSGTYDNSTNYRFTPGVVGKYLIGANVTVKDVGDGKKVQVAIYENGSNMNGSQAAFMNTNGVNENLTVGGTWLLDVDSTSDYYEIYVYQNKGSTQELRGDFFNNFYGFRVG
jgi:hypothetical protein